MLKSSMRFLCSAILFSTVFISCSKTIDEKEPNDLFLSPQNISGTVMVRAAFNTPGDLDFYQFTAAEGKTVSFKMVMQNNSADPVLLLYRSDRTLLKTVNDHDSDSPGEICANLGLSPGRYILRVENLRNDLLGPLPYLLQMKVNSADGNETEPNDDIRTACTIARNRTVEGSFRPYLIWAKGEKILDCDFYRLRFPEAGAFTFHAGVEMPDGSQADPVIEIFDAQGASLVRRDNQSAGSGESIKNMRFEGPCDIFISISSRCDPGREGGYTLINEAFPADAAWEGENNNSIAQACPFTLETEEIRGNIASAGDEDVYRLDLTGSRNRLLNLTCMPPAGLPVSIAVLDQRANIIAQTGEGDPGAAVSIANLLIAAPALYVRVSSVRDKFDDKNEYVLRRLLREYAPGVEEEPNDSIEDAGIASAGIVYTGYLSHTDDRDCFKINVPQAGSWRFEITPIRGSSFNFSASDEAGRSLTSEVIEDLKSLSEINVTLPQGDIWVRISADLAGKKVRPDFPWRFKLMPMQSAETPLESQE